MIRRLDAIASTLTIIAAVAAALLAVGPPVAFFVTGHEYVRGALETRPTSRPAP